MANRQYRIIGKRSDLPPTQTKVFTLSNANFSRDFVQQDKGIVLDVTFITNGSASIAIDTDDSFVVNSNTLQLKNLDMQTLTITGQTSGYVIIQYLELNELVKLKLVKVN